MGLGRDAVLVGWVFHLVGFKIMFCWIFSGLRIGWVGEWVGLDRFGLEFGWIWLGWAGDLVAFGDLIVLKILMDCRIGGVGLEIVLG